MYCSIEDIYNQLDESFVAQLSNDDNPNDINRGLISELIEQASSLVDGYISNLYKTPLTTIPAAIQRITANLSCYYLYLRRGLINEHIRELYNNSIDDLTKIKDGIIKFDIDSNMIINNIATTNKTNKCKLFSEQLLRNVGK